MKKVHVITGGSGGIGLETAKQFPDGIVVISDINEDALADGKEELEKLGITTETALCDVTNREQIVELFKKASNLGQITNVIHAAGVSSNIPNVELIMDVNLRGSTYIIEELLPYLHNETTLICIASMVGYLVTDNTNDELLLDNLADGAFEKIVALAEGDEKEAYNISKRGVQLLCEKWAVRYGQKKARIISVSPGIIETEMVADSKQKFPEIMQYMMSKTALGRTGQPAEIASLIKYLSSPEARFITGTDILIDGGLIKNLLANP